jgi:hypothetical protein
MVVSSSAEHEPLGRLGGNRPARKDRSVQSARARRSIVSGESPVRGGESVDLVAAGWRKTEIGNGGG